MTITVLVLVYLKVFNKKRVNMYCNVTQLQTADFTFAQIEKITYLRNTGFYRNKIMTNVV